jgi:hypothetical protein
MNMAKKRKPAVKRTSASEPEEEDDSEDEWEEIVEPSGVDPDEPPPIDPPPTYGLTTEEDWHPASENPPSSAPVMIETPGESEPVQGYKQDGVWYAVPEPNEDGSKAEPTPVQVSRWK